MKKLFYLVFCFCVTAHIYGRGGTDSLTGKSYNYLIEKLESDDIPAEALKVYAMSYLTKARAEGNWRETANAYKSMLNLSQKEMKIAYADSMLTAANKTRDNILIGSAYLSKGMAYYVLKRHAKALNNYLLADGYLSKTDDEYLLNKVKFNIAQIKYYLGFYNEALALFRGCTEYYRNEDNVPYLISLHAIGLCYNQLRKYEACTSINNKGIKETVRLNHPEASARFIHSEGVNQYFRKNYRQSIALLQKANPDMIKSGDFANEAVGNFYLGKSYWELGEKEKAIGYFEKVDFIFQTEQYLRPDMREGYELLIRYYKENGNTEKQLGYIDQLLKADKSLNENYRYLSGKVHKEYDTKKLLCAKEDIERSLDDTKRYDAIIISLLLTGIVFLVLWQVRIRKRNREKFEELMSRINATPVTIEKKAPDSLDINPEVVASVLKNLDKFEETKKYLKPDLTQFKLAQMFGSNTKYIARIIQHYKGKKSIDYINDLRIDYITGRLSTESKLRNYTQQALAEEAGFSTAQHFTRAFLSKNEITVSYYITQLIKEESRRNAITDAVK